MGGQGLATQKTNTIAQEFNTLIKNEAKRDKMIKTAPIFVLVALISLFTITTPGFFSVANFFTLLTQLAVPLIIALGITYVVLVGSIDLSVDGVIGLTSAVVSLLVLNSKTQMALGVMAIPVVLGVGALCGLVTGVLSVKGKIPSFMVSFGMLSITTGLAIVSYGAVPAMVSDSVIRGLSLSKIGPLPQYVYVSVVVFIVAYIIQEKTAFGKYMFAIGENEEFCRMSGINVSRIKILVFVWSGMLMSIAGIIGTAQIGRGDVAVGTGQLFRGLSAVVLGGTALTGGKGGVLNTLLGALIIVVLNNGLVFMGVNPYFKDAIVGAVLIVAVILSLKHDSKLITK